MAGTYKGKGKGAAGLQGGKKGKLRGKKKMRGMRSGRGSKQR